MKKELESLPAFTRVKNVRAARITGWADNLKTNSQSLTLDSGCSATCIMVDVTASFVRTHQPKIGDYFTIDEEGNERIVSAQRFEQHYRRAVDPKPILWPEIQKLASMQPQAEVIKRMPDPVVRGGDIFGTRAQMDTVLGKGAA